MPNPAASTTSGTLVPADLPGNDTIGAATLPANDTIDPDGLPRLDPPTGARFSIVVPLGRGGLGEVYAADDRDIGRRVAIKRVRSDRRSDGAIARFVQEVRTVGQLEHPNIVPVHDVGREKDGSLFFVMKYLDGETLETLIARLNRGDPQAHKQWTFARRVEAFQQVLHAVAYAHQRGFVHRDLKPANVMVGNHGQVHVVDWGLAKKLGKVDLVPAAFGADRPADSIETRAGAILGTPMYMAPEQARGEPADERTDVYQLSLVLYELLTLSHPFADLAETGALTDMLDAVQNRPIPHPRALSNAHQPPVPAELAHYVMRGLSRNPADRFATVHDMIAVLELRDDGEIAVACPVTLQKWTLHRAMRLVDRYPRGTLFATISAGVLAAGGLVALVGAAISIGLAGGWLAFG